jgi:hypothetical protein
MKFGIPAFDGVHGCRVCGPWDKCDCKKEEKKKNRLIDCGSLFLDSGAHSLYNEHVVPNRDRDITKRFEFYTTQEFRDYLDAYAAFIKANSHRIDRYVTVDVIYNPELSWQSLKYLENEHGLDPVPVIHSKTPLKWVEKYIKSGYDYLGIGGLGQDSSFHTYAEWGDRLYSMICPASNGYKPIVKTHGFAMTGFDLMRRYPWYSVDSASWAQAAAFGMIYIPHKRYGKFTFNEFPYFVCTSMKHKRGMRTPSKRHYLSLPNSEKKLVQEWLDIIQIPLGEVEKDGETTKELGVLTHYGCRATANLYFYQAFADALPSWPWPFKKIVKRGFFND